MTLPRYCLDTHALIWYFTGHTALSSRALVAIEEVFTNKAYGVIPVLVILEIYHFSLKKNGFNFPKFLQTINRLNIDLFPLDGDVLNEALLLPKKIEIHDRTIGATALVTGTLLITKDEVLKEIKDLKILW